MGYTLGTFIPLVGGGYVAAKQRSVTVGGSPSIELLVQQYDANKQPIGQAVVIGRAFSNAITGAFTTITGYDLAAAPYGGFDVIYTGSSNAGNGAPTFTIQAGTLFNASGAAITSFTFNGAVDIPHAPHLIPLLNGGFIIQQDWSFWVYDARGNMLSQVASSGGELHDLGAVIIQTTTRADGTVDQWRFPVDERGVTAIGTGIVTNQTGTAGDDVLVGSTGADSISGGAGADTLTGGFGFDTLSGGTGADRFVFGLDGGIDRVTDFDPTQDTLQLTDLQGGALPASSTSALIFDARSHLLYWDDDGATGAHQPVAVAMLEGVGHIGLANLSGVQPATFVNITGLGSLEVIGSGVITGGDLADSLTGGDGVDTLSGGGGDDAITGGGGSDVIDGGAGVDTAIYAGAAASFRITVDATGWKISDLRTGRTTDVDTLRDIERVAFQDKVLTLGTHALSLAVANVMRAQPGEASAQTLLVDLYPKVSSGQMNAAVLGQALAKAAIATTSVATLSYQFFTGKTPGEGGMDYLVAVSGPNANNLNSAYYQSFNLENRYINFAVNLGKLGEGAAKFLADYGALDLFGATRKAYAAIFGTTPTDEKVHALIDTRTSYFEAYGHDGPNGAGAKAAMVGWLLAEAAKADVGVYALSNDAFLTDVALHNAPFGVDLVGAYSQPGFALQ